MNFVIISAVLTAGILSAQYIPVLVAVMAAVVFSAMRAIINRKKFVESTVLAFVFLLGFFLYHCAMIMPTHHTGNYVTLSGRIISVPYNNGENNHYILDVRQIDDNGEKVKVKERIAITSKSEFNCGDCINVHGKLEEFDDKQGTYEYDTKQYYAARGIYRKMYAFEAGNSETKYKCLSPYLISSLISSKIGDIIHKKYSGDAAAAMTAVLTGNKKEFSDTYNAILLRTATRHLYYPAFIHIMLIMTVAGLFARAVPYKIRSLIVIAVLLLYAFFNCSAVGALRCSLVMALILTFRIITNRGDFHNAMPIFVIVSEIISPLLVFDAAFVMSCSVSIILRMFKRSKKKKLNIILYRYIIINICMFPLSMYYFGKVSMYSYFASFIFIPIIMLIIVVSPLFLLGCMYKVFYPVTWIVHKLIMFLLHIPLIVDRLPFSVVSSLKPSPVFIAAFYVGLMAIWFYKRKCKTERLICLAVAMGLFASQIIAVCTSIGSIEVDFIDVGQGDAALIHIPFSGNLLIDGGGGAVYSDYNIGEKVFVPYLNGKGVKVVQAAFVSHYHKDHAEGIIAALKNTKVLNLFLPDVTPEDDIRLELEQAARENNTKIWYISRITNVSFDDVTVNIYPSDKLSADNEDMNETSLMIDVQYGEFNCLFTGDMTQENERYMLSRSLVPKAEVLKIAHHGSKTSTTEDMVNAVSPQIAVISVGEDNEYGLPSDEVIGRLKNCRILRTDYNSDISIFSDKKANIKVKTRY